MSLGGKARAALAAEGAAPRQALLDWVRCVDLAYEQGIGEDEEALVTGARTWIAAAVVTTADLLKAQLGGRHERIAETERRAARFLDEPSVERWDALFEAATASYPFGPGDGCLAVEELGGHGAPGAGCTSGAGFVMQVVYTAGDEAVLAALREAASLVTDPSVS